MEAQHIYDAIARHLYTQGVPAKTAENHCKYRIDTGERVLKCAVGSVIPDQLYKPEMECRAVTDLVKDYTLPSWMKDHKGMLQELQIAHDHCALNSDRTFDSYDLDIKLHRVADTFGVIPYNLDKFRKEQSHETVDQIDR